MGFAEVIGHLRTILNNLSYCKKDITQFAPDAIIFIDYPGFNLRIVEWAHKNGYKTIYYISPQIWAWKENRVKLIRSCVDKLFVILPFEKAFYKKWDYEVEYVGHPLLEVVKEAKEKGPGERIAEGKIIALLPGSRKQEVLKKLPVMLKMIPHFPEYAFVMAQAPHLEDELFAPLLKDYPELVCVKNRTYELLQQADAALVTSGTATLETALFGVPQVVCYIGSPLSYFLAKQLVKIKYISLVNLILDKEVVTELIQNDLNEANLKRELQKILTGEKRQQVLNDYQILWNKLNEGNAAEQAAKNIVEFLKKG
jgi:lipid-A-disaccharide synthase